MLAFLVLTTLAGRTDCRPYAEPETLPALNTVLDSAALATRLLSVAPAGEGPVTLSLRWSAHPEADLLGASPRFEWHEAVLRELLASLRPAAEHASLVVRVQIRVAANPTISLERSVMCRPEPIEGQNVSPPFGTLVTTFKPSPIPGARPERLRAKSRISEGGVVTAVTIISSSGYPEIDRDMVRRSKAQRYRPALLDGRPVAVWMFEGGIRLAP